MVRISPDCPPVGRSAGRGHGTVAGCDAVTDVFPPLVKMTRHRIPRCQSKRRYLAALDSHLMPVSLTTVRQDSLLTAEYAVRFAVARMESPDLEHQEAVLDPKLVVRGTNGRCQDN